MQVVLCPPKIDYLFPAKVRFTEKKFQSYKIGDVGGDLPGVYGLIYDHHNIDNYPGALFLRNWGLNYLNSAMSSLEQDLSI